MLLYRLTVWANKYGRWMVGRRRLIYGSIFVGQNLLFHITQPGEGLIVSYTLSLFGKPGDVTSGAKVSNLLGLVGIGLLVSRVLTGGKREKSESDGIKR